MIPFLMVFLRLLRGFRSAIRDPEFQAIFAVFVGLLTFGTIFYHRVEGWGWVDSLYFCVITLATVGYGDFSPQTDLGKLFTVFYILAGIGSLLAVVNVLAENAAFPRFRTRDERARLRQPLAHGTHHPHAPQSVTVHAHEHDGSASIEGDSAAIGGGHDSTRQD